MTSFLDNLFRAQPASALLTNTGALVDVSAAAPPVAGYVLQAVDDQHAIWVPATGVDATARVAAAAAQATANAAALTGAKFFKEVPTSPHADDIEFTAALSGWDCRVYNSTSGLSQAMTLGSTAVDPRAALSQGTGNVNVNTQRASWLHLQSWPTNVANNASPAVYCKAMSAPVTNMFVWGRLGMMLSMSGTYDPAEMFRLAMCADDGGGHPDARNWVGIGLSSFAGTRTIQGSTCIANSRTDTPNNASGGQAQSGSTVAYQPYEYYGVHKRGTAYDFWLWTEGLSKMYLGSLTTSMTLAWLGFEWSLSNNASSPGVPIHAADFIRRLDNVATFPF